MLPYIIVGVLVLGGIASLIEAWRSGDDNSDVVLHDDDEFNPDSGDENVV